MKPTWSTPVLTEIYPDPNDKSIVAVSYQDCDPILENNKELRSRTWKSDGGRHIADVPNVLINQWLTEEWTKGNLHLRLGTPEWQEVMRKKLSDPNYKYLRTDK